MSLVVPLIWPKETYGNCDVRLAVIEKMAEHYYMAQIPFCLVQTVVMKGLTSLVILVD